MHATTCTLQTGSNRAYRYPFHDAKHPHVALHSQQYSCIARHALPGWAGHGLHTAVFLTNLSNKTFDNPCEHAKAPWRSSCVHFLSQNGKKVAPFGMSPGFAGT